MKNPQRILHRKNKPQGAALIRKEFHIALQAVERSTHTQNMFLNRISKILHFLQIQIASSEEYSKYLVLNLSSLSSLRTLMCICVSSSQDIACVWGMFMRLELDPSQQVVTLYINSLRYFLNCIALFSRQFLSWYRTECAANSICCLCVLKGIERIRN